MIRLFKSIAPSLCALALVGAAALSIVPAAAQGVSAADTARAQNLLHTAAAAHSAGVEGALRQWIAAERKLITQDNAAVARERSQGRQRFGLELNKLINAQGNPGGIGTSIPGAFREFENADARPGPAGVSARNNAQIRLDNYIQRWNTTINSVIGGNLRTQRQGLTSRMEGALRELESYDRQMASASSSASTGGASANTINQRIKTLQTQITRDQQQLDNLNHAGATKAAQDTNTLKLKRQIEQSKRDLTELNKQAAKQSKTQAQSGDQKTAYIQQNRVAALEKFRLALAQTLQLDAQM